MAAKSIMVVGTMSSSGKSFITAGLCRILAKDGFKVAPFKAQNMALNSYITKDNLEIGRAQAMQAEAAMIEPEVRMNPILLKPTSQSGSQVIVHGKVYGNMTAREYYKHKKDFAPKVMEAYNSLAEDYEVIVLEGAGSPAEINLKDVDIVNMGMAKMSSSPVILVGDIDRGGVFASLYGTIALMDKEEKDLIKGMVINKFRGDVSILENGITMIEELTDKKVLGIVPYLKVEVDDEDSLSDRLLKKQSDKMVDIAVIRLPRISNFTDFNVFDLYDIAAVRYVESVKELGEPDLIIIPGTKNTIEDLLWLRQNGLEASILKKHSTGCKIIGICGGFQMLGKILEDPDNIECGKTVEGIGLLDVKTVFKAEKTRTRVDGKISNISGEFNYLSGVSVSGYEIHMGATENLGTAKNLIELENGKKDGYINADGSVFGTYLHGIFDSEKLAGKIVGDIANEKGISNENIEEIDVNKYKNEQYDILEQELRKALNMDKIYEIIGLEKKEKKTC